MTGPDPGRGAENDAPVVDARGTRCPVPVIRVARVARDLPAGSRVVLVADDVAARSDVPAWGRMRGHAVEVGPEDPDGVTTYRVVVAGAEGAADGPADGGGAEKST